MNIEWSNKSIVHNIFRVKELLFGRPAGIRAENRTQHFVDENGKATILREFYTTEALLVYLESEVYAFVKKCFTFWKGFSFSVERVYIPQFAGFNWFDGAPSPYLFAIAFDATTKHVTNNGSSPQTFSHTTSGSNRGMVISTFSGGASNNSPTVTYNSVSCTNEIGLTESARRVTQYSLIAPATGSNTVSISWASNYAEAWECVVSYTGVDQTDMVDVTTSTTNANTISITTLTANSWVIASIVFREGPTIVVDSPSVERQENEGGGPVNGSVADRSTTTTGSYAVAWTPTGTTGNRALVAMTIVPSADVGPANLKTRDGVAKANIKTINGVAIGNIKSINGVV